MDPIKGELERLRRFNAVIRGEDPEADGLAEGLDSLGPEDSEALPDDQAFELESIVMRRQRPVLAIRDNDPQLVFIDEEDVGIWKARLEAARPFLQRANRAAGRIELEGARLDWVGTGWLVHDNILVTNRHVAIEFAMRRGEGFTFRTGDDGTIRASIDFLQEIDNPATLVFKLLRPLHIEESPGPDVAFFEVEAVSGDDRLAEPIRLARQPVETENAATIGYPAYDSRIPELDLMERIYGRIYNKKRLAPGGVTRVEARRLLHNCTTLGGNSGSVVLDLDSGEALGLHYSGSFLAANYAVRSDLVADLLERVRDGRARPRREQPQSPPAPPPPPPAGAFRAAGGGGEIVGSVTFPLTISVSLGKAVQNLAAGGGGRRPAAPFVATPADDFEGEEAVAEDYRERPGYRPDFLDVEVELPRVVRDSADVLSFEVDGKAETELRYEHFSVVLNRTRRMCFFSAVNINGNLSRKSKRTGWRWDPRVPRSMQIMNECYGPPPRFSRGHMTRREDPAWGEDPATIGRGNSDSMHVTNVAPQMQAFNSPIWLALEDYALQHAREDAMNISVFTGPYFTPEDPTMYGVRIPLTFWKIIAFIHDDTRELSATGYQMNQEGSLVPEEEFVFGAFTSPQLGIATQVPIRSIAERAGISFGPLAAADPLDGDREGVAVGGPQSPLGALEEIRFIG